ncbi:MAG: META domain-containing protein [Candidatus Paceibacterota bacterium]
MNLRTFFVGRAIGFVVVLAIVGLFFFYKSMDRAVAPVEETPIIKGELLEGGEADPAVMKLDMTTWRWVSALYNDGRTVKPNKPGVFTLSLSPDGTFTATTDCNSAHGTYTTNKNIITFGPIAMTKMYCEGSQESEFVKFLENTSSYHFTTRGSLILDLKYDSGTVTFQ